MAATSFKCDSKSCYGSTDNDRMIFTQVQATANALATQLGLAAGAFIKPDGVIGEKTRDLVQLIAFASAELPLSGLRTITQQQIAENAPQLIVAMTKQIQSPQPTPNAGTRPPRAPTAGTQLAPYAMAPPLVFNNTNTPTVNPGGGDGNVTTSATPAIMPKGAGMALAIGSAVLAAGLVAVVLIGKKNKGKEGVSGSDWSPNVQKAYRAQKAALTRAKKSGPEAVLKAVSDFHNFYEQRNIALPDDHHRWERAKDDAEFALRRDNWTRRTYESEE